MRFIRAFGGCYCRICGCINCLLSGWFIGLFARFVFAAVLLGYYWNSALTKVWNSALIEVGSGYFDFFIPQISAYTQILPTIAEQHSYNLATIPFLPYGLIVLLGTYSEIILPVLVVVGLFTQAAALAMIGFIVVQSFVDIVYHQVDPIAIGAWFDNIPGSAIGDQRLLWIFLLSVLVVRGAGVISLDWLLCWGLRHKTEKQPD